MIKGVLFDFDSTLYNYEEANNNALDSLFNYISIENEIDNIKLFIYLVLRIA